MSENVVENIPEYALCMANRGSRDGLKNIVYLVSEEDAMKFCSSPLTKGNNWMFVFSKLENFLNDNGKLSRRWVRADDGRFADLIEQLNIETTDPAVLL